MNATPANLLSIRYLLLSTWEMVWKNFCENIVPDIANRGEQAIIIRVNFHLHAIRSKVTDSEVKNSERISNGCKVQLAYICGTWIDVNNPFQYVWGKAGFIYISG